MLVHLNLSINPSLNKTTFFENAWGNERNIAQKSSIIIVFVAVFKYSLQPHASLIFVHMKSSRNNITSPKSRGKIQTVHADVKSSANGYYKKDVISKQLFCQRYLLVVQVKFSPQICQSICYSKISCNYNLKNTVMKISGSILKRN